MSFYKGLVAKLVCIKNHDIWYIVDVFLLDSQNDKNIDIQFHYDVFIRAVFIPTTKILKFDLDRTRVVKRHFDFNTGLECWEAI
jgi:hypothetical protein